MTILSSVTLWQRHDPLSPTVLNSKLTPIVSSLSALETLASAAATQGLIALTQSSSTITGSTATFGVGSGLSLTIDLDGIPTLVSTLSSGATGPAGTAPAVLTGTAVPDPSLGTDGDTYYQNDGSKVTLYTPKASSSWPTGVLLNGPAASVQMTQLGSTVTGSTATLNVGSGLSLSVVTGIPTLVTTGAVTGSIQMTQLGSTVTSSTATLNVGSGLSVSIITGIPTLINTSSGATGATGAPGPAGGASITLNNKTSTYTAVYADLGSLVRITSASLATFVVPAYSSSTFTRGDTLMVESGGTGTLMIGSESSVTINRPGHTAAQLAGQYATAVLVNTAENVWDIPAVGLLSTEIVSQDVSIVTNVVDIDYSAGRDVNLVVTSNISRFNVTNSNASGTVSSLAVWLEANGIARTVTWSINSATAIWDGGTAPTSNSTASYVMGVQLYTKNAWVTPRAYLIAQGSHS